MFPTINLNVGSPEIDNETIAILAKLYNVSPVWLIGFDVPMERNLAESKEKNDNIFLFSAKDDSMSPLLDIR